jgi:hypothetical protein
VEVSAPNASNPLAAHRASARSGCSRCGRKYSGQWPKQDGRPTDDIIRQVMTLATRQPTAAIAAIIGTHHARGIGITPIAASKSQA